MDRLYRRSGDGGPTWTDCVEGALREDSGGAVTRDTPAGKVPGAAVDVATETPSASFCNTFPTAAWGSGKMKEQRKCYNYTKVQKMCLLVID